MTRVAQRTNLNSSRLIRCLADLAVVDTGEARQDFAARLGQWLDVADAITLSSGLSGGGASGAGVPAGEQAEALAGLEAEFARVRTALVKSISESCAPSGGGVRLKFPTPNPGASFESATAYAPYHRFYLTHQRDMDTQIGPLRAQVRKSLAQAVPALKPLAHLDAAFDGILLGQERKTLATVPGLLEKRFDQLRKSHEQQLAETQQADDSALWLQGGGWLAVFRKELQGVLLAELEVRLQPTIGLIEAFSNEVRQGNE